MASIQDIYRYEITSRDESGTEPRPVAEHGMGLIYRAYDPLRNEIVALKIVRAHILEQQPAKVKRSFLAEAIAGARLGIECPQIVAVYDIGQYEDILYMAQEWIPGGDIKKLCGRVTLAQARQIVLQVANAVRVAHTYHIVHSDIAPSNILFDQKRDIFKLSDFGLLKLMSTTSIRISGSSAFLTGGRVNYMPQEHFVNPGQINYSTDVFALAIAFYELLTGELPPREGAGYVLPFLIPVAGERSRHAPNKVFKLLDKYITRRDDDHSIVEFAKDLSAVPI